MKSTLKWHVKKDSVWIVHYKHKEWRKLNVKILWFIMTRLTFKGAEEKTKKHNTEHSIPFTRVGSPSDSFNKMKQNDEKRVAYASMLMLQYECQ